MMWGVCFRVLGPAIIWTQWFELKIKLEWFLYMDKRTSARSCTTCLPLQLMLSWSVKNLCMCNISYNISTSWENVDNVPAECREESRLVRSGEYDQFH